MAEQSGLAELGARVEALEAKDAIWRLMARYAKAVDEEDDEELAAIFTGDATCETVPWSKGKVFHGREAIVRLFNGYQKRFRHRKRYIANELIDLTGRDTAKGWSNWLVVHANDGDSYVGWGSYDWGFRRENGHWLISEFVVRVEVMTTLAKGWADAEQLLVSFPRKRD